MTRTLLLLTGLALTTACTTVSGEIDGENPSGGQAFFIQEDEAYGEDGQIQVYLTDVPDDACEAFANFYDDYNEGVGNLSVDDVVEAYTDNLPESYWLTVLTFRVDDVRDEQGGLDFKGVDWDEPLEDDDEMHVRTTFQERFPDEDDFELADIWNNDYDFYESWRSDEGTAKVGGHTPSESISGRYEGYFVDDDGDDVGEMSLRFSAQRCRPVENEIY